MSAQRRSSRQWNRVAAAAAAGLAPALAALLVALPAGGCRPKTEPTLQEMPTATEVDPEVPQGDYRAEALDGLVESLEQKASALPGRDVDDHRRQMHALFGDVVQVLPILEGPEPSGAFRQQLRTVEAARDRLDPEAGNPAVEPTIDAGLRATYAALSSIGRDEPYVGQKMAALLSELGAKIDELDAVRSVGRPYVTADAVKQVAGVARHMADVLGGRATDTPATGPTEPPLVPPGAIEAPRAMPSTQPAAEPAEAPTEETPTEEAPAEDTPAEEMPADDAPAEDAPAEEAPPEEAPTEEAPGTDGDAPATDEPDADAPAEDMPAEETPAEETPAEETPADEPATDAAAPAEDAPADDAPAAKEDAEAPKDDAEDADAAKAGEDDDEDMNK